MNKSQIYKLFESSVVDVDILYLHEDKAHLFPILRGLIPFNCFRMVETTK